MNELNLELLFQEAKKIAGKESKEHGSTERDEQEKIAKKVKTIFEKLTDSIVEPIEGWAQGKGSRQASIRPKGNNNNPFASSIWNFYKPEYIDAKEQDKSLLLIYVCMDVETNELFTSIGIHDRRNNTRYRANVLSQDCIDVIYEYIADQIEKIQYDKNKFELRDERKFIYKFPLKHGLEVVDDFKDLIFKLLTVYQSLVKQYNFLENDEECTIKSQGKRKEVNLNKTKLIWPLNQILYGPPGTGKTFNMINKALEIIDGKVPEKREDAKKRFDELKESGQIVFTTFHQSFGYEEFVEGIKANSEKGELSYDIEDGIFKELSLKALRNFNEHNRSNNQANNAIDIDRLISDFANNVDEILRTKTKFHLNDSVLITEVKRNKKDEFQSFVAGGNIKAQSLTIDIIRRDLEKYFTGIISKFNDIKPRYESKSEYHGNATYYFALYNKIKEFYNILPTLYALSSIKLENHILIIDEINRGNISKIFGELITLIEDSKRIGKPEEIRVSLPYSGMGDDGKGFGVPSNLYILGTMNTADRSIALMDTALRRRFHFEEMLPEYKKTELDKLVVETINIGSMLRKINERIEYLYDRDHQIGHAYFMSLKDNKSLLELENIFKNKIIPLLQEYFYDDWEKIQLVLGDNQVVDSSIQFVRVKFEASQAKMKELFGNNTPDNISDEEKRIYELNKEAFQNTESYLKIYTTKAE